MLSRLRLALVGFLAFALPAFADAAEPTPPKGFTALFNGKDFTNFRGWSIHDKGGNPLEIAKLTADERQKKFDDWTVDLKKNWTIENGELVNKGVGAYLSTEKDYGDYELMVEYKLAATVDSGCRGVTCTPTSCADSDGGLGTGRQCGLTEDLDCCERILIDGGSMPYPPADGGPLDAGTVTVSPFILDKYEVGQAV